MLLNLFNNTTNGFNIKFTSILFIGSVLTAIVTIAVKNTIVGLLFLISLFVLIGIYLYSVGLEFLGFGYILIYVGAVSILFLFILMLVNIRTSELLSNNIKILALAGLLILSLVFIYFSVYFYSDSIKGEKSLLNFKEYLKNAFFNGFGDENDTSKVSDSPWRLFYYYDLVEYVMGISWDGLYTILCHIVAIGNILYTSYSIWLIIVSIILLLTMNGAIVVTVSSDSSN
uniref:NADH-ubiquinone oxidoreductase chain 6 n=2 Tax=Ceratocystis TaxID=5157 RepID=A0A7U1XC16_9PEZI|nr:NADH dehydrogenase subunit 6 [Ceratocystis changhui]QRB97929.1 NADH dehydrogenase subunit 6 [Ceratocystis changhui]QRB98251.1 NADH dehydrogenase subunit 6 [Ceratocystis fimbriata]